MRSKTIKTFLGSARTDISRTELAYFDERKWNGNGCSRCCPVAGVTSRRIDGGNPSRLSAPLGNGSELPKVNFPRVMRLSHNRIFFPRYAESPGSLEAGYYNVVIPLPTRARGNGGSKTAARGLLRVQREVRGRDTRKDALVRFLTLVPISKGRTS